LQKENAMFRIQTILHPTDFSEPSRYAFETACALARDYHARLVLMHVVPPYIAAEVYIPPPPEDYREKVWEEFRELQARDPKVRELRVETLIREGDPAAEILRLARETNPDLIVMGTHGRTGLRRVLMGSVAEKVLRRAPCPVLTVKGPLFDVELVSEEAVEEVVPAP
jgi:nucleotide-binding universal stress UspA family protein